MVRTIVEFVDQRYGLNRRQNTYHTTNYSICLAKLVYWNVCVCVRLKLIYGVLFKSACCSINLLLPRIHLKVSLSIDFCHLFRNRILSKTKAHNPHKELDNLIIGLSFCFLKNCSTSKFNFKNLPENQKAFISDLLKKKFHIYIPSMRCKANFLPLHFEQFYGKIKIRNKNDDPDVIRFK